MTTADLKVTSHVGRDLLSSAAAFKTEGTVVWEYVVNSLQYVARGTSPRVNVSIQPRKKSISISDNGTGMDRSGLKHFFTMHGENLERQAGRVGRGKFGTGKSAAFGIANTLTVDTTRNGLRNVVRLTREMIEASEGEDVPLDWVVQDEETDSPNGTIVTLDHCNLTRIRTAVISEYVERHLQAFRALSPEVAVNNHVCVYREPEIESQHLFEPSSKQAKTLGEIQLRIKVARAPLPDAERGVTVTAGVGNLVAVESGGIESKDFGGYLFGDVDVPALETTESPIEPYDSHRTLQLNPEHPVVAVLVGFIGSKLEAVRKQLVEKSREARQDEEMRRLAEEADRIAEILNDDFQKVKQRLQEIRAASSRKGSVDAGFGGGLEAGDEPSIWIEGIEEPGELENQQGQGGGAGQSQGREAPEIPAKGSQEQDGTGAVDPAGGSGPKKRRPRGGFSVQYRRLGKDEERSRYDSSTLTILINLDHPVVAAAIGDGRVEDPVFKRLSYEIAFSEYAMGLGYEAFKQDPHIPADDLLYEVRSSLNRVSLSAAPLYSAL